MIQRLPRYVLFVRDDDDQLGFMYARYTPNFDWWEVQIMMRKMIIVISYRFATDDVMYQSSTALVALTMSTILTLYYRPFYAKLLHRLEVASVAVNSITMALGVMILLFDWTDSMAIVVIIYVLILCHCAVLVFAIVSELTQRRVRYEQLQAAKRKITEMDEMGADFADIGPRTSSSRAQPSDSVVNDDDNNDQVVGSVVLEEML